MGYQLVTDRDAKNFTLGSQVPAVFGYPRVITNITLHWWGKPEWKQTWEQVMNFFCDSPSVSTSAHEVISDGIVGLIVDHSAAAWANGNSQGNAQSITLECNPRMSAGDMGTVAARIADIWREQGRILPLTEHRDWFATECPGTYSKSEMTRQAMLAYRGIAAEIKTAINEGGLSVADIETINKKLDSIAQGIQYIISYSQPGRDGINVDSTTANWLRNSARAAESWAYGVNGVSHQGQLNKEFQDLRAKVDALVARPAAQPTQVNIQADDLRGIIREELSNIRLKGETA